MVDQEKLAKVLAGIAQTLITEYGIADVLHDLCDDVIALLEVSGAGVMLCGDDGHLRFAAASDERSAVMESLHIELAEGPCLQAYQGASAVIAFDLAASESASAFDSRAVEAGITAIAAFPMSVKGRSIGALSLYRESAGGFREDECDAAQTLAASAAAFVLNARALDEATKLADQLRHALDSRVVIEQAKGKLSQQLGLDVAAAFNIIRAHARNHGERLTAVAQAVVDGELILQLAPPQR